MTEPVKHTVEAIRARVVKARAAIGAMRDATRQGIELNHFKRDPLVMDAHRALDDIEPLLAERDALAAELRTLKAQQAWQPIETAPKGSWLDGPGRVDHPDYIAPPDVWLLMDDGQRCVGSADAYYAEGGGGEDGGSFWVETFSGERVNPTHWQPLPQEPPR